MHRMLRAIFATLVMVGLTASLAAAQSPHFKHGGDPTCTFTSGTSTASATCTGGTLAGLGNQDVTFSLSGQAEATYSCTTPSGSNQAPGQNKVQFASGTASATINGSEIKNGTLVGPALTTTGTAPTVTAQQAGCPNNNWQTGPATTTITSVTLSIRQGGTLLFTCTASNPGPNQRVTMTCTSA
jgi:hypothetical protein